MVQNGRSILPHGLFRVYIFAEYYTAYAVTCGVEGLAAGEPVADRQYRYTCSQSLPDCALRPAVKNGTQAEMERRML